MAGTFLLRIEDIDLARCKPEFTEAIFEDLHWLGLHWPEPVLRQSGRFHAYATYADRLRQRNLLYPCFCSRSEIAAHSTGTDPDAAPLYPGTCRHLHPETAAARLAAGEGAQWRLRADVAIPEAGTLLIPVAAPTPDQPVVLRRAQPERWGDVVLVRKDTPTSYHLSVVVDDAAQQVTHVTRGRDMEAATDIHVLLQKLLDLPTPTYTFHELLLDADGHKLSKSRGSETLADLREQGWTAEAIRRRVGLA